MLCSSYLLSPGAATMAVRVANNNGGFMSAALAGALGPAEDDEVEESVMVEKVGPPPPGRGSNGSKPAVTNTEPKNDDPNTTFLPAVPSAVDGDNSDEAAKKKARQKKLPYRETYDRLLEIVLQETEKMKLQNETCGGLKVWCFSCANRRKPQTEDEEAVIADILDVAEDWNEENRSLLDVADSRVVRRILKRNFYFKRGTSKAEQLDVISSLRIPIHMVGNGRNRVEGMSFMDVAMAAYLRPFLMRICVMPDGHDADDFGPRSPASSPPRKKKSIVSANWKSPSGSKVTPSDVIR